MLRRNGRLAFVTFLLIVTLSVWAAAYPDVIFPVMGSWLTFGVIVAAVLLVRLPHQTRPQRP